MGQSLDELMHDGGVRVYQHFGVNPYAKKQKENPLRAERTCSFSVFYSRKKNCYLWHDFGMSGGNAISFVKHLKGCNGKDAIEIVKGIYGNPSSIDSSVNEKRKSDFAKKFDNEIPTRIIEIEFNENYTERELAFWKKKGFVSEKTLRAEKVLSLKRAVVEYKGKYRKEIIFSEMNFAFEIVPNKSYKIYSPSPAFRPEFMRNVKSVSFPNQLAAKELHGNEWQYTLGLDTVDFTKPVFLIGGEADYLASRELGLNSITLGSETAKLPEFLLAKLKTSPSVHVLFDTDFAGRKASYGLRKKYRFEWVKLPKLGIQNYKLSPYNEGIFECIDGKNYRNITENCTKPELNDLCDYLGKYGNDFDLKKSLNPYAPFMTFPKKLSDGTTDALFLESIVSKRVIWEVPTGAGKTTVALSENLTKFGKNNFGFLGFVKNYIKDVIFIYIAPLTSIVEATSKEYANNGFQTVCDGYLSAKSCNLTQNTLTTFNSALVLLKRIKEAGLLKNVALVIDEIHEIILSAAYQKTAELERLSLQTAVTVGLSATISQLREYFEQKAGYKILPCVRTENPKVEITIKTVSEEEIGNEIVAFAKEHANEKTIYFRDAKQRKSVNNIHAIARAINKEKIPAVAFWGGISVKAKKAHKAYQALIESQTLPEDCKHLVATRVVATGITANVENIVFVATKRNKDIVQFMQAYARNRAENIKVMLFIVDDKGKEKQRTPIDLLKIEQLENKVNNYCRVWNKAQNSAKETLRELSQVLDYAQYQEIEEAMKLKVPNNIVPEITQSTYFADDKYWVNLQKIVYQFYANYIQNTTNEQFIEDIRQNVPNSTITIIENETEQFVSVKTSNVVSKQVFKEDLEIIRKMLLDADLKHAVAEYTFFTSDNENVKEAAFNFSAKMKTMHSKRRKLEICKDLILGAKPKGFSTMQDDMVNEIDALQVKISELAASKVRSDNKKAAKERKAAAASELLALKKEVLEELKALVNEKNYELLDRNIEILEAFFGRYASMQSNTLSVIPEEDIVNICFTDDHQAYGLARQRIYHALAISVKDKIKDTFDPKARTKRQQVDADLAIIDYIENNRLTGMHVDDLLPLLENFGVTRKNVLYAIKTFYDAKTDREGNIVVTGSRFMLNSAIIKQFVAKFEQKLHICSLIFAT